MCKTLIIPLLRVRKMKDKINAKNKESPHKYKTSDKRELSSDAKVIIALMKRQPLEIKELAKVAGTHPATVSRNIRLLINKDVLKVTPTGYALRNYIELEGSLRAVLQHLKDRKYTAVSLRRLSDETNLAPTNDELIRVAYSLAPEYGLKIREKDEYIDWEGWRRVE